MILNVYRYIVTDNNVKLPHNISELNSKDQNGNYNYLISDVLNNMDFMNIEDIELISDINCITLFDTIAITNSYSRLKNIYNTS